MSTAIRVIISPRQLVLPRKVLRDQNAEFLFHREQRDLFDVLEKLEEAALRDGVAARVCTAVMEAGPNEKLFPSNPPPGRVCGIELQGHQQARFCAFHEKVRAPAAPSGNPRDAGVDVDAPVDFNERCERGVQ